VIILTAGTNVRYGKEKNNDGIGRLKGHISLLRVFISDEQIKENDENIGLAVNNFCSA
jgi:hypothetical protein